MRRSLHHDRLKEREKHRPPPWRPPHAEPPAAGYGVLAGKATPAAAFRKAALVREAVDGLRRRDPDSSAALGLRPWQGMALIGAGGLFAGAAMVAFRDTVTLLCGLLSLVFLLSVGLRVMAVCHGLARGRRLAGRRLPPPMDRRTLPVYSVLVPLHREAHMLRQLVAALCCLDYPPARLDIKLILEASDAETVATARAMDLPGHFDLIIVPDRQPRTKPKALNYALPFATGRYVVVYDAEDRPEPDQLLKAVAQFRRSTPEVVCLQARLAFRRDRDNWLARQFTIEYWTLFGGILPMLDAWRLPIPLGGTSNHFRIEALRRAGAWDAYNVTEDADLGMRLYRRGWRCAVLDSTTEEEPAWQFGNWLRQRSRWLKGWMQTYGVHMRRPGRLLHELGLAGFLAFQGHFAGIIIAALVHPLGYGLLAADALHGLLFRGADSLLGVTFWGIAAFNLAAGYGAALALGLVVLRARDLGALMPQLAFIPIYWLLLSAAAYRAVYQLVTAPYYWDKTEHGVGRTSGGL